MQGIRIVYVEDDPSHERLVRGIVEREGGALESVGTARDALAMLTARPPDAALVDLLLPDGTGIGLIRELRERGSDVPLVVVTASDAPEDAVGALQSGAQEYLVKPIHPALLVEAIRRAVAAVRRQRELARLWAEVARTALTPGRESPRLRNLLGEIAQPEETPAEGDGLIETVERIERRMIREALERTGWVKARAARNLGVTERILSYKMQTLGIRRPGAEQGCWKPTKTSPSSAQ